MRIVASTGSTTRYQLVGHQAIAAIAQSSFAAPPGTRPRPITMRQAPAGVLGGEEVAARRSRPRRDLRAQAECRPPAAVHALVHCRTGELDPAELSRAQMRCCYVLSQVPGLAGGGCRQQDPLSDRDANACTGFPKARRPTK